MCFVSVALQVLAKLWFNLPQHSPCFAAGKVDSIVAVDRKFLGWAAGQV